MNNWHYNQIKLKYSCLNSEPDRRPGMKISAIWASTRSNWLSDNLICHWGLWKNRSWKIRFSRLLSNYRKMQTGNGKRGCEKSRGFLKKTTRCHPKQLSLEAQNGLFSYLPNFRQRFSLQTWFPRAMRQHPFGECREGRIPRCKLDARCLQRSCWLEIRIQEQTLRLIHQIKAAAIHICQVVKL